MPWRWWPARMAASNGRTGPAGRRLGPGRLEVTVVARRFLPVSGHDGLQVGRHSARQPTGAVVAPGASGPVRAHTLLTVADGPVRGMAGWSR